MATVYLETSFVSACVTNRTDTKSLYRLQISREWWQTQASKHALFISAEVVAELSSPTYPMRSEALNWIEDVELLAITDEVLGFADILVAEHVMPSPSSGDAMHVAVSTIHRIEYVLSWNVKHLANVNKQRHLQTICVRAGLLPPRIITPELLWES